MSQDVMNRSFARGAIALALLAPLVLLSSCRREPEDRLDRAEDHLQEAGENLEEAAEETERAINDR